MTHDAASTPLAAEDFYQALNAARSFSGEAVRALAIIAVARTTFEKTKSQPPGSRTR